MNNKSYIYKMPSKYSAYTDVEDLMQEAYFGLHEAVQKYENTHETKFMTYGRLWIKQSIARYIENSCGTIRIPNELQNKIQQYKKCIQAYELQLGRKSLDGEIVYYLGVSMERLRTIKKMISQYDSMQSLDTPLPGTEDMLLYDSVPDQINIENNIVDKMMNDRISIELWEMVQNYTSDEENFVILARYKDELTFEATGQIIGKSRDMARQIEAKVLRKLRTGKCIRELKEKFEVNFARAYRGSLTNFNNTWTSSTEYAALKNYEISV